MLAFAALWFTLGMSPGPNAAYCIAAGLSLPRRTAMLAPLGIAAASLVHVTVVAVGVGSLMSGSRTGLQVLKWVGVAYLAWLGLRRLRGGGGGPEADVRSGGRVAVDGALVSLSNPKAILQYLAVLPQFVTGDAPALVQFAVLGAVGIPVLLADYTLYVVAAAAIGGWIERRRSLLDRGIGLVYLLATGLLAGVSG